MSKAKEFLEIYKINNKDYKFWVVVNGKIYTGWEYKEDAQDDFKEMEDHPKVKSIKIYQRVGLKKLGLDPDNNNHWSGNIS